MLAHSSQCYSFTWFPLRRINLVFVFLSLLHCCYWLIEKIIHCGRLIHDEYINIHSGVLKMESLSIRGDFSTLSLGSLGASTSKTSKQKHKVFSRLAYAPQGFSVFHDGLSHDWNFMNVGRKYMMATTQRSHSIIYTIFHRRFTDL